MPSYEAVYNMITDDSKESTLMIHATGTELEPYTVQTLGDVFIKNMGAALLLIYVDKETKVLAKRAINPAVYDVLVKRTNPLG